MTESNDAAANSVKANRSGTHRKLHPFIASWSRWLHIYLSLFDLANILFFSVTGLTLNQPDCFFAERTSKQQGHMDVAWLNNNAQPPDDWDEYDFGHQVSKLQFAEYLRANHRLQGSVSHFLPFKDECELTFQSPGYAATARINRESGEYTVAVTANDLVSVFNDLHKGRHSGQCLVVVD